jgi:hypothetical protein
MKVTLLFALSFVIGSVIGTLLFGDAMMLGGFTAEAATWSRAVTTDVAPVFALDTEKVVSLITAGLLFASAYVIWNKYRTLHYFDDKNQWRTL